LYYKVLLKMKQIKNTLLLLFTINLLWGIICAIPSLFVVGFTLDGWFPSSYQNPDSFFPPSRDEELLMLTIASVFFILYYFHLIVGVKGFMINDTYLKKYSSHFQYNILLTLLGLGFMISILLPDLNHDGLIWLFPFALPTSSLIISIRGFIVTETIMSKPRQ